MKSVVLQKFPQVEGVFWSVRFVFFACLSWQLEFQVLLVLARVHAKFSVSKKRFWRLKLPQLARGIYKDRDV